jgi:hypothetical protein
MAASARLQAKAQRPGAPLWPLLCSCIFVGLMLASEIVRAYRVKSDVRWRPATKAFGTSRNSDEPAAVHRQRADEPGRGRHAEMPSQIPWRGWKGILWRTYEQIGENRLLAVAAGVVFYGLLAVFPGGHCARIAVWPVRERFSHR